MSTAAPSVSHAPGDDGNTSLPFVVARRYACVSLLGRGGASEVFLAVDHLTGREVALKRARRDSTAPTTPAEVAALRRVHRASSAPGVVRLLDDGVEDGRVWMALERVEGAAFPGVASPCPWEALRPVTASLLEALARIHAAGVVHGDLKPDNVLVGPHGRAVVMDFGVAAASASDAPPDAVHGTWEYLAPERADGLRDARSDLFSVGVMLYGALTGRSPWRDGPRTLASLRSRGAPAPLTDVAAPIAALVARLLDPSPAQRPASADEALAAIERGPDAHGALDVAWPAEGAAPWSEAELARCFHGPTRLSHVPDDAARLLVARAHGDPGATRAELARWVRQGLATLDRGRVRIDRDALETLAAWDPRARRGADTPRRWVARARSLAANGRLAAAEPLLREALRYAAAPPCDAPRVMGVARLWARVVFAARDRGVTARFLYELARIEAPPASLEPIAALVRAFDGTLHWTPNALDAARSLGRFDHPATERLRYAVRVDAARKVSVDALTAEVGSAVRAHRRSRDPAWRAQLALWTGRLRYVQERYGEAARCHARAAKAERWRAARINAALNAASAWLEAFAFERARTLAAGARDEAARWRLPFLEGRAEWLWRTASDRAGVALSPDLALLEASRHIDAPDLTLVIAVTEATLAWRAGDRGVFADIARIGREACGLAREGLATALLDAMEVSLEITPRTARHARMADELAAQGVPRLALEVAALVTDGIAPTDERAMWLRGLARTVPPQARHLRLGVLSAEECLTRLGIV